MNKTNELGLLVKSALEDAILSIEISHQGKAIKDYKIHEKYVELLKRLTNEPLDVRLVDRVY